MSAVFNVILPVFAIILAGYLSGKAKLLGSASSEALNAFVYRMALPAVLFLGTARRPLAELLNGPFIGAFLGSALLVYALGALLGRLLHRERPEVLCMQGLTSCFSNIGYMGIPLFLAAFGPDKLAPAILATVLVNVSVIAVAVIWLEAAASHGQGLGRALKDVGRAIAGNPLILASAAGILLPPGMVPQPLITFCELLGAAAGPCALVAIGLFLATRTIRAPVVEIGWVVALKLLMQPLLCWLLTKTLFPMDPFWTKSALIIAALPIGTMTFVVASQYRVYVERASAAILVSTVVSLITVGALLALYTPG